MAKHIRRLDSPAPKQDPPTMRGQLYAVHGGASVPTPSLDPFMEESTARVISPTLVPPGEHEAAAAERAATEWLSDKKIEALWSDSTNCNSWIAIPGLGWKKLFSGNESALVNMTLMAAHAEQTNASVNIRVEADGMVHEIYVW
jgi:hypothetical protein